MADNYMPGGTPDWYAGLLKSAQQQLVRMPDGSYRVAPQMAAPTSLSSIYGGMYPSNAAGSGSAALISHPVKIMAVDSQTGLPVPSGAARLSPAPGSMKTAGQAGNIALPPGVVPRQAQLDMAALTGPPPIPTVPQVPLSHHAISTQERLGITPSPIMSFAGDENTGIRAPGVAAIKAATNPFAGAFGGITGGTNFGVPSVPRPQFPTMQPQQPVQQMQRPPVVPQQHPLAGIFGGLFGNNQAQQPPMVPQVPQQQLSPDVHAALMAQQSADQRGLAALQASGMVDQFGQITGSGGHSSWGSH